MDFLINTPLYALFARYSNYLIPYISSVPVRLLLYFLLILVLSIFQRVLSRVNRARKSNPLIDQANEQSNTNATQLKKGKHRTYLLTSIVLLLIVALISTTRITKLGGLFFQDPSTQVIAEGNFNWIELDAKNKLLYAVGHGTDQVLAYHTDRLSDPPSMSEPLYERSQSIALNSASNEIYYPTSEEIIVLGVPDLKIKERIKIPELSPGDVWIVWDEQNDQIVLSSEADENVGHPFLVVDRKTGKVVSDEPLNAWNIYLHPSKSILYLGPRNQETKYCLYDTEQNQVVSSFESGELGDRMILDENRDELLIAAPSRSRISRYDPMTFTYLGSIKANWGVRSLAIDRERDLLFAGSLVDNMLIIIDLNTGKTIRTCWVGPWIRSIALDTENRLAYVSTKYELVSIRY